jgi:hypothetical protein
MSSITYPIDPFLVVQGFGEHPENYKKFGLAGHNGWDIKTKYPDTPLGHRNIYASFTGDFFRKGVDPSGFGNFFEIIYQLKSRWKVTYAHCLKIYPITHVQAGEVMAISDSTGNSTGSHLHLTVKRITIDGTVLNNNNGYFGAIDPQEFFNELKNFSTPIPIENTNMVDVEPQKFEELVTKATFVDNLVADFKLSDMNELRSHIIEDLGTDGKGGLLQSERNAKQELRQFFASALDLPIEFTQEQFNSRIKELTNQSNNGNSQNGSKFDRLLELSPDFEIQSITLAPKKE